MRRETDKYHLMKVFHAVASKGNFSLAAQHLSMTASSVSKAIKQLESSLNCRLMNRSTRSLSLTASGKEYLISVNRILHEISDIEERIHHQNTRPSGNLRISVPTALGQFFIAPKLHQFIMKYPDITIDLTLNERIVDLVDEGIDVAIRSVDVNKTSSYYSCSIGSHTKKLVASPDYLETQSLLHPKELQNKNLLNYTGINYTSRWSFNKKGKEVAFVPRALLNSNNYYTLYCAALNGLGIANLYQYLVDDDLSNGRLIHVLPEWQQSHRELFAIYQQRREEVPKVDVFIEFLKQLFT